MAEDEEGDGRNYTVVARAEGGLRGSCEPFIPPWKTYKARRATGRASPPFGHDPEERVRWHRASGPVDRRGTQAHSSHQHLDSGCQRYREKPQTIGRAEERKR